MIGRKIPEEWNHLTKFPLFHPTQIKIMQSEKKLVQVTGYRKSPKLIMIFEEVEGIPKGTFDSIHGMIPCKNHLTILSPATVSIKSEVIENDQLKT